MPASFHMTGLVVAGGTHDNDLAIACYAEVITAIALPHH